MEKAALADLPRDEAIDAVLEVVDLAYAGDFCFVEVFWEGLVRWCEVQKGGGGGRGASVCGNCEV